MSGVRAEGSNLASALTHLNNDGAVYMVDVGAKASTKRVATASARVRMRPATAGLVVSGGLSKGEVLATCRLAGIMAAKETARLIPLCHPVALSHASVDLKVDEDAGLVTISARCETTGPTGVEMEALVAASTAALTLYDMAKAVDREMVIEQVQLESKEGGRSGSFSRKVLHVGL